MKKDTILCLSLILFFNLPSFSEPMAISYLSLGGKYNTLFDGDTTYYFYGFDEYSEAIIWDHDNGQYWTLQMNTESKKNKFITFGGGYPLDLVYETYGGESGNTCISAWMGASADYGYEYKIENGKLVYWTTSIDFSPRHIAETINENTTRIEINTGEWKFIYSNKSREELLDFFLKKYLENIDYLLGDWKRVKNPVMKKEYNDISMFTENITGRTGRELAIFRNYIFARHNYKFISTEWNLFFKKYYKSDYTGTKTNEEVMSILTNEERLVLKLIIEEEQKL
jgi:hypothetical protein